MVNVVCKTTRARSNIVRIGVRSGSVTSQLIIFTGIDRLCSAAVPVPQCHSGTRIITKSTMLRA